MFSKLKLMVASLLLTSVCFAASYPPRPAFYSQTVYSRGIPIYASSKVAPQALQRAKDVIYKMTSQTPKLAEVMVKTIVMNAAIVGKTEDIYQLPEYSHLNPNEWGFSPRGLGPTLTLPTVSGSEENIMCDAVDPYKGEAVLVHEFGHAIHLAIKVSNPIMTRAIEAAYRNAIAKGLWRNTYAITNLDEYFAEMTQSWFNMNLKGPVGGNGLHNEINNRALLKTYDQAAAVILEAIYGTITLTKRCP